ncbi:Long-chain base-1-phosphate phosphatase [Diatrype stigma]|uniref:Long-chain base-1-phosphate phosphatase n=1 Tax=Diatrype stigma TaxID=117547 RepID=A0AAN9UTP3_9PEZI
MNRSLANGSSTGAAGAPDRVIKKRDENGFVVEQIQPNEEKQRRLRQQKKEEQDKPVIDAGLKSLDHCTYAAVEAAAKLRTPALDSYFAITANLGTHTFFMIFLPIMFWCGFASFGKGIVHILAAGVFWSGFIKDFFSLPRPLSPPLHRITMSGSVALEYGFPSTHSANAVSVAVYAVLCMRSPGDGNSEALFSDSTRLALEALSYFYAASIIFGRLYCGMHGFIDVIVGSILGAVISLVEWYGWPIVEAYVHASGWGAILILMLVIIVLIRIHPEPADDCPCFDDSVAFAGVLMGLEAATWHLSRSAHAHTLWPFDLAALGWQIAAIRIVTGILAILVWKEAAKPTLLRLLPHLFRLIETHGLSLPRRFFVPASEYGVIPPRLRVDNVMPSVSDLPGLLASVRGPGRGRSVSVGPQSAADAYETLAYRERRRRESVESNGAAVATAVAAAGAVQGQHQSGSILDLRGGGRAGLGEKNSNQKLNTAVSTGTSTSASGGWASDKVREYERQMGEGTVVVDSPSSLSPSDGLGVVGRHGSKAGGDGTKEMVVEEEEPAMYIAQQNEDDLGEQEVFARLVKPRVRYDVEVVAKLVVYAGEFLHF